MPRMVQTAQESKRLVNRQAFLLLRGADSVVKFAFKTMAHLVSEVVHAV